MSYVLNIGGTDYFWNRPLSQLKNYLVSVFVEDPLQLFILLVNHVHQAVNHQLEIRMVEN